MDEFDETEGEQILSHSKFILNLTGFWPEKNSQKSIMSNVRSKSIPFLWGTMILINCIMICTNFKDITTSIPNLFAVITMMKLFLRISWLVLRKSSILEAINKFGCLLSIKRNRKELRILKVWRFREARAAKAFCIIYIIVTINYCILPILSWKKRLPLGVNLPAYAYETPWFYLICFCDIVACVACASGLMTEDIILTFFISHLCGELECIAEEILKFNSTTRTSSMCNTIKKHVVALSYGREISQLMSTILYIEIISSVMDACASVFTILLSANAAINVKTLGMLLICIFRVFMICFCGETMSRMSLRVHEAVMKCDWYRCTAKNQKAIHLVLLRAQKPLQFRVGTLGVLNLRGFSVFIFNLYSCMTVLNTVIQH